MKHKIHKAIIYANAVMQYEAYLYDTGICCKPRKRRKYRRNV